MAELLKVAKAMFQNQKDWSSITDEEKEDCFFVFNRYFSKKYPNKSQIFNDKFQDKIAAMDLWFHFMKTEPYPKWFWSKSEKEKSEYTDKEIKDLLFNLQIKRDELNLLIKWYPNFIKEELKYYKDVTKGNK